MRRLALLLATVGIGSIAASLALVPGATELAIMRWKDGDLAEARTTLEGRWHAGKLAAGDVLPLVDIYVQTGAVRQAIGVLEGWAQQHPAEVAVRRKLGELYLGALRPADYERNLDVLLALEPGEDLLRELAGRVASTNDHAARKRILGILSQQEPEGSAADVEELARLLAAESKLAEAAHELLAREQYLSATGQALLLNLLHDLGRDREAETVAEAWVEREPSGERLDRLIDTVQDTGQGRLALHLLDRWHHHLPPSDARLIGRAGLLATHGREAEAGSMVERRLESGRPVEPGLVSALLEAAWAAGLSERVRAEALARPAEQLSDRLLASLLDEALQEGDRPFIDRLLAHAGTSFLETSPLIAATWAVDRQDWAAARLWLTRVEDEADPEGPDILRLAQLYEAADEVNRGRRFMERLRREQPGPAPDAGWALLAMAGGDVASVRAWLPNAPNVPPEMLAQLTRMAIANGIGDVAVALANELVNRPETPKTPVLQSLQRPLAAEASLGEGQHGVY